MTSSSPSLRAGMIGMGMIFDETYRPFFEHAHSAGGVYDHRFGVCRVTLSAVASRTGTRAEAYRQGSQGKVGPFESFAGPDATAQLLRSNVDFACVATPDNRHFEASKAVLTAGKHLLLEKPSV